MKQVKQTTHALKLRHEVHNVKHCLTYSMYLETQQISLWEILNLLT